MNLLAEILSAGNTLRGNLKRTLRDPIGHANAQVGAFDDQVRAAAASGDTNALLEALGAGPGAVIGRTAGVAGPMVRGVGGKAPKNTPFPDIYLDPRELVARAKVAPEDPIMRQLFGVTRDDLYEISQQGTRAGNMAGHPFKTPPKPRGAGHVDPVMTPRNEQRLVDIITETRARPDLFKGMASWYTMDPLYQEFVRIHGKEAAPAAYRQFNALTGMASPASDVLTEINRGTAANWLANQGRFEDFVRYGGVKAEDRGPRFPNDLRAILGHTVHSTAQAKPMAKYLDAGGIDMKSPKVPSYIHASGVPEVGFQTHSPVGDAHWSRLMGLPEVRGLVKDKKTGEMIPNTKSASTPEMVSLAPWFRENVAQPSGLEAVPAQAVVWGAGSNATGVKSPVGAPKLELLAQQIRKASERLGISPEEARDLIIAGKAHAGFIDPRLLLGLGTVGAGGAAAYALTGKSKKEPERKNALTERLRRVEEEAAK